MDDVLCETCRGLIDLLHDEFGRTVDYEDVHDFDLGNSFKLTRDELDTFLDRAHEHDVLAGLAPIAGAKGTLEGWVEKGFDIAILTGRPPSARRARRPSRCTPSRSCRTWASPSGPPGGPSGTRWRSPPRFCEPPRRAWSTPLADSTRWTMNWSVHQYQMPNTG